MSAAIVADGGSQVPNESSDDRSGASLAQRLRTVRRQLDLLAATRLDGPLNPDRERAYQVLCSRERDLLDAMAAADARG